MKWHHHSERGSFRGWLNSNDYNRTWFKLEVGWRHKFCLIDFGLNSEDSTIGLSVAVPYCYIHLGVAWPRKMLPSGEFGGDIEIVRLSIHDATLYWKFWGDENGWSSKTPKWRDGSFNPVDFLFGRNKYSEVVLYETPVSIPMPEKNYTGTVKLLRSIWKRPRAWWVKTMLRANVDVPGGIPFPGKGENSWDCGEDATFSMTCQAATVEQAVGAFRDSVMKSRARHGGKGWMPAQGGTDE